MKKLYIILFIAFLFTGSVFAQQSTETFETESANSTSFTDNGQNFDVISQTGGTFKITDESGYGWSGSTFDNRYIDNSGTADIGVPVQFTIKTTGTFTLKSIYLFLSQSNLVPGSGNCTITGKLNGSVIFIAKAAADFNSSLTNNGFTLIDLSSYGGSDNSNKIINEYTITTTGAFEYVSLDAMKWEKILCPAITVSPLSQTNLLCNGISIGAASVTASGGSGFTYNWKSLENPTKNPTGNGTASVTGLSAGSWTCTVTNSCGNTGSATFIITEPLALTLTQGTTTPVKCFGDSTGSATVNVTGGTGPYSYAWSPSGGTQATASGLGVGTYTVTVTDNNSCTKTIDITIGGPTVALTTTINTTPVSCFAGANGTATVTPVGGTGTYTYLWSNGATTATTTGLTAGTYNVTVKDANLCSTTITGILVGSPSAALTATTSTTPVSCFGGSNGTATVTPLGGTGEYSYLWSTGAKTATITGRQTGTYSVTITDANYCTFTINGITINQPAAALNGTTAVTNVACNGGSTGVASVTPLGGTSPYTIEWNNGAKTQTITGLLAGTYSVTITDANSCTRTINNIMVTQPPALNLTSATTNVACNGGSNGVAAVTATGGAGGYTYLWNTGAKTAAITGLTAGTYSVTVTDDNSCTKTINNINVTQPAAIDGTISTTSVSCFGGSNGSASVTAIGGVGGYSYSWSPTGGNDAIATGLTAGTYRVTITDANSCSKTINDILVGGPTAILTATPFSQTDILCNGSATGSATVTAVGGTGTYTYAWSPSGGTAATATGLTAGTYTVTVTDSKSCSTTQSFTIIEPDALVAKPVAQTNIACNGGTTGSATVTATGGTGSYTYSWSPSGGTAATASGLAAGTYTVTVTDKNLCSTTQSFTITQPAFGLSATTASTGVSCFGGSNGTASVTVSGGTPNYSYLWEPLGGSTSFISGRPAGDYTCTITDANGCTLVKTVEIKSPAAFSATVTQTDVSCNGGSNGSATITATGATAPYSYTWLPTGGSDKTATGLAAGDYTVLVQDANTCVYNVNVKIKQPAALTTSITKTDVLCNGGATGTATVVPLGGTKPYSYVWSSGGGNKETATGLKTGYYTCTITDARGCFVSASITVDEPAALSAATSKIDATCTTSGEASVSVNGGTTPYSYEWSSGQKSAIATGLAAGNYTCVITDANGCIITKNVLINTTNTLVAIANQTNILCNGANTGSAWVVPAGAPGPFTYVWAPYGGSSDTASNLTAGNYSVTITAANGCSIVKNFTLTESSALVVIPSQTNLLCHGAATGSASVNVTGGTGSYTYKWAPTGGTDATATGLTAGTYTVTITDGNLCETTQSFTITEPNPIKITINSENISCNGESNGSATATVIGGTGTYTYAWSPSGGTAATASGLSPGNYTITVTDANNCSTTESVLITEPNVLTASIGAQIDASCNGSNNGSATVAVSGGFGTYTYSWSPSGGTAATATGLSPGTYTATVTDANNCTAKQSFTIGEPAALKVTSTQKNVTCYNADNGEATVTISGGIAPYSYKWSNSDSTTQTAQNLLKGDYVCTITDSNNCSVNQNFTITQPSNPLGLITSVPTEFTASSATLTLNASQNGIDGDLGECTSEIGLVFAAASNPKISDSKIILGSNPGTFTKIIEGLLGNTVYYVRAYSIGKFGYVNYGNEISFTTQKNILKVVAASDQTKVYGSTEPKLTYQATGFVNGDNNSIITGLLSRTAGENAGTYPITIGTLSAGANYTIDFKTSDFKITKANQVIEWNQDLAFGCNTTDQVQLTASSDSGLPVSYAIENSSVAAIQGDVLKINRPGSTSIKVSQEGDQNHNPAVQITKLIEVSQSGNISQYWEDTLLFDNSDKNYSAFQWFKNGVLIPGATSQYYSEKPLKGTYSVQAKNKDGNIIKFCPLTIDGQTFSKAMKLYPNPVQSLRELTIESDYSAEELKDSRINIFDLSGKLVTTVNNVSPKVIVTAPSSTGIYVVVLSLANGQHKTINLLVR